MPVGNDVVDLRDPANRPSAIHHRFDRRVFGAGERDLLRAAPDRAARHRLRWALWAAKEAAFKCLRQSELLLPFHPRELVVSPESPARARVRGRGREMAVKLHVTAERLHAVAWAAASSDEARHAARPPLARVRRISAGLPPPEVSARVRRLAAEAVSRLLDIPREEVEITGPARTRPEARVPRALWAGEPLPVEISLSHDGRWLACAVGVQSSNSFRRFSST